MERAAGIEPAWPAWKAGTLPLSYARFVSRILRITVIKATLFLTRMK
jgi:hypothetical protein